MSTMIQRLVGTTFNTLSHFSARYAGAKALELFRTPLAGSLNKKDLAFLATAQSEVLTFNNYPVQTYQWMGSGPRVLLLHGWESNSARWQPLIERLINKNCNVIALDAPAHGASGSRRFSVSLYASFLDVVCQRCSPQILVGHSMGGQTLAYYLNKYVDRPIRKAALLGTPAELKTIIDHFNHILNLNQKVREGFAQNFHKLFGSSFHDFSVSRFAQNFKIPALVVHDEEDDIAPFRDGLDIAKQWQNSSFLSTKGLGHALQGDVVHREVVDFILRK